MIKLSDNIILREMTNNDYSLVYNWVQNDFVYKWFEQRVLSLDEVISKYEKKINNKNQVVMIIEYNNKPIGLLQYYKYKDSKKYLENYNNIYEYDLFIGEKSYLSKGLGSIIINSFNDYLFNELKCDCIILRPLKDNDRASNCYKKCGFDLLYEYNDLDTIGNNRIFQVYKKSVF